MENDNNNDASSQPKEKKESSKKFLLNKIGIVTKGMSPRHGSPRNKEKGKRISIVMFNVR